MPASLKHIGIVGGGSWGTALVKIFSDSGIPVSWIVRDEDQAQFINQNGRNPKQLGAAGLNKKYIHSSTDFNALAETGFIIFAVPSAYFENELKKINPVYLQDKHLAVSIKGFIPGLNQTPSEHVAHYLNSQIPIMVLAGPCHAEEIAMERNTYLTVSSNDADWVDETCNKLSVQYVKAIPNNDPRGVEYTAILKNVIGIAAGIAAGLNYGENFQAVLISNAMREVNIFLQKIYPAKRDLFDSAYFGDMLVTAYSEYSRNRGLGKLVGRGIQVSNALQSMEMIAEGYHAVAELHPLLKGLELSLPIMTAVYRILYQHANPFLEFKLVEQRLR
ncbi:MAG: NAD(P)-binding domain-containing protein [Bacteroidetes bacterium]|nr:NAD(P)-binding domain-containing protein [Bacteroidota bacterium]